MDSSKVQIAHAIGSSTTRRLAEVQRLYGLDAAALRALSANLAVVARSAYRPSVPAFDNDVAEPRRLLFVEQCLLALTDAEQLMNDLLADPQSGGPQSGGSASRIERRREIVQAFDQALCVQCVRSPIVRLGDRWYRHLQRRTVASVVTNVADASARSFSDRYRQAQLELLESAPWNFQDRLLTAYESADRQVAQAHRELVASLNELADPSPTGGLDELWSKLRLDSVST